MENALDALHMAFAVLIFVLALTISISLFSQARETTQYIIEAHDKENDYIYVEGTDTKRKVGIETIVPAMYRAYKENYIIVFKFKNNACLFEKRIGNNNTTWEEVNVLNLAENNLSIGNNERATLFIDELLYEGFNGDLTSEFPKVKTKGLFSNGIYDIIKGKTFLETLGLYYIDDVIDKPSSGQTQTPILSSDVNKTQKRVITYTEI